MKQIRVFLSLFTFQAEPFGLILPLAVDVCAFPHSMGLCVVESIVEASSLRNALPLSLGSSKLQLLMRVCTGNEKTSEPPPRQQ